MTAEEIRSTRFDLVRKGYRPEDVEDYLQVVAEEVDRLEAQLDAANAEKAEAVRRAEEATAALATVQEDADAKMYVLAEKVEEYRGQEETLKTALINAQRMGEVVVHEAKQKAEQMLRDATGQAELLRAKAERETARERDILENLLGEVNKFKTTVLNLYKQHIESLSALDPPTGRAEEVLEETLAYKTLSEDDFSQPEEEPVMGVAQPTLPDPLPEEDDFDDEPARITRDDTRIEFDTPISEGIPFEPVLIDLQVNAPSDEGAQPKL